MKKSTEFGGDDLVPANVQPKPADALSPSERLRLTYLTGQDTDSRAKTDGRRAWTGQAPKQ